MHLKNSFSVWANQCSNNTNPGMGVKRPWKVREFEYLNDEYLNDEYLNNHLNDGKK